MDQPSVLLAGLWPRIREGEVQKGQAVVGDAPAQNVECIGVTDPDVGEGAVVHHTGECAEPRRVDVDRHDRRRPKLNG